MTTFRQALQDKQFAISAELSLRRDTDRDDIARQAKLFSGRVDGVQVADNPLAWVHMSAVSASAMLIQQGLDPVPILTCRDRNRIALLSDLLGLKAMGVTSLLLTRGRRVPKKHALHASTVFDLTGRELIAMAAGLGDNDDGPGYFFIGTGVKAHRARKGWRAEALREKATAGAQFIQTQICYNLDVLRHYLERLVEARATWNFSVIASLAPLPSVDTARWIREHMADSKIPPALVQRIEQAADPEHEAVMACAETMQEMAEIPGLSGVHLMTTGSAEHISAAIDASGLARSAGTDAKD